MNKNSPGPWRWEMDSSPPDLLDANGRSITVCPGLGRADGRLIAAAPRMAELLRKAERRIDRLERELDVGSLPPMGLRGEICALLAEIDEENTP